MKSLEIPGLAWLFFMLVVVGLLTNISHHAHNISKFISEMRYERRQRGIDPQLD